MLRTIRGMRDISEEESEIFYFLESKAHAVFRRYNFSEIRTPILEYKDLFLRGVGEDTDIVSKEMYTLQDRKEQSLVMRPEGTAAIVRHVISENLLRTNKTKKFFYSGPMFRFERPQKGRYRQFHQIGAEFFGEKSIYADLELILMLNRYLKEIGIEKRIFEVNWLGSLEERKNYKTALREFLKPLRRNLCELCQIRCEKNPMRILDCKNPECQNLIKNAPEIFDSIGKEAKCEFDRLQSLLIRYSINFHLNSRLVRGLDYYSNLVFEIYSENSGAQSALGGGGRYDELFELYGEQSQGATGFALGADRLALLLSKPSQTEPLFFIAGKNAIENGILAEKMRCDGFRTETDFSSSPLKNQFKQADKRKASYTLILGEEEIKTERVSIKKMANGKQILIPNRELKEVCDRLLNNKSGDLFSA